MQQAHVYIARQAVERAAHARQLKQERHEIFELYRADEVVQRREETYLRGRILRVRRDEIVRDFRERGEMMIERRMIAGESYVDRDAGCGGELRQAGVERVVGRAADEGDL